MTLTRDRLDRPYVVTGSSSGVGWATCQALSASGVTFVAVDVQAPEVTLPGAVDVIGDVGDPSTWKAVRDAVRSSSELGAAGLITCAGTIVVDDLLTTSPSDFSRLFAINTLGVLHGMQALLPDMIEQRDGAIVVVASVDSMFVEEGMSAYATSKGALLQLTRSAALEYARFGVRINAVCPGAVDTPLLQKHFESTDDATAARVSVENACPTGRVLQPEEIANVLLFLASPMASAISGAAIVADGGMTSTYDFRLDGSS
jgi:NAD(P)-dependent dehydrogenase (short-subunit alcohol dehydrogenase family)